MYNQNIELLRKIKSISWQLSSTFKEQFPNVKTISTSAMYAACTKPFDENAVALAVSQNKSHEHYGKSVEEIKADWETKRNAGATRGNSIDDYVKAVITGQQFDFTGCDEVFINKAKGVDKFFADANGRFGEFVGDEIWLFDTLSRIKVRCDTMFVDSTNNTLYVCEWKNISKFKTFNARSKCFGPLEGYDNCDLIKVNIQAYTYKYILENSFFKNNEYRIVPLIVNFIENDYVVVPSLLDSSYQQLIPRLAQNAVDASIAK